ncbi:MAG: sensor histidine kinase [Pseudolysinimonas sp.]
MSTTVRVMQLGQHAIAAVLLVVGSVGAFQEGVPLILVGVAGGGFALWYGFGSVLTRRAPSNRAAAIWLVGLAVIWAGMMSVSTQFIWLAFPLWLLAGHLLALRWAIVFSVLVSAVTIAFPIVKTGAVSYPYLIGPLVGGVFAFGISRGYFHLLRSARERQELIVSLVQAQDEMAALHEELARTQRESGAIQERTRISRDIHDTIAQGLSAIVLITRAGLNGGPAQASTALDQIQAIALDSLVDVRRIVDALAPAQLEVGALASAIQRMLDRLTDETDIHGELNADANLPALSSSAEVALLRTAQSAIANVRLHSKAKRVVVSLIDAQDAVRLDIVDDGRGFSLEAWEDDSRQPASRSYGIHSMRARLRELGGGLDIESAPGEGTALSAYVPLGIPLPEAQEQQ